MDNCLIVCSQPIDQVPGSVAGAIIDSFVIAVDGGLTHVQASGIVPDVWVGDGDSLKKRGKSKKGKGGFPRLKLPRAKDYTDLEYAFHVAGRAFLEGAWEGDVILVGAQGGRFDHELGNLFAAERWLREIAVAVGLESCPKILSYGPLGLWVGTVNGLQFKQPRGKLFSVLAPTGVPRVTISGAKYNLRGKPLEHASQGLSNEGTGKTVRLEIAARDAAPVFVFFPNE